MRARPLLTLLTVALVGSSALAQPRGEPLDAELARARAEHAAAEREAARLEQAARQAQGEATRLRAEQAAAAQAIEAAESRITAASAELRLATAKLELQRRRLEVERRPVASLLAGLTVMARRPPLLAVIERGSIDDFVRVRALLDTTMPAIRARTAALSDDLRDGERLAASVGSVRAQLVASRQDLLARRDRFSALEQRAAIAAGRASGEALSAGDAALASGESLEQLAGGAAQGREAARVAAMLAAEAPAPAGPTVAKAANPSPLAYRLPVDAPVVEGLGAVSSSGIRSRGVTFATPSGVTVAAPAAGTIRFAGPFRSYDGIMIIDHGGGWISLLVNVASPRKAGERVRLGDAVGRSLGPLVVELSQNGRRISPAIIAGSSPPLSKHGKAG